MVDSVCGRGAVLGRELHDHVVLLAVLLEARHLPAAEQRLERAAHHRDVEAEIGDLGAIHLDAELGHVELQVGLDAFQPRIGADALQHQVDVLLELLVGARRLDHELDRARGAALRRTSPELLAEALHAGDAPELRIDLGIDLLLRARALVPVG